MEIWFRVTNNESSHSYVTSIIKSCISNHDHEIIQGVEKKQYFQKENTLIDL